MAIHLRIITKITRIFMVIVLFNILHHFSFNIATNFTTYTQTLYNKYIITLIETILKIQAKF